LRCLLVTIPKMQMRMLALLTLALTASAAECGHGDSADVCLQDETSLMQVKKDLSRGNERAKPEVTFVATINKKKWYLWFKRSTSSTESLKEPVKNEVLSMGHEKVGKDLFALNSGEGKMQSASLVSGWDDLDFDDWEALHNGWKWRYAEGGMCPGLGLGLPGCRHLGWDNWDMPHFRRWWTVFAALPVDKSTPAELTDLKPEEIRDADDQIESHMKGHNYFSDIAKKGSDSEKPTELDSEAQADADF